jgi:transposase
MLNMKEYSHIRKLKHNGISINEIVEKTGYARNTVRKVLRSEADESSYTLSAEKPSTVEPYRAQVTAKLQKELRLTRIWREIREENGFAGSYSAIRRFARRLKRENPEAYIRFETLPGEQTQNDWSSFEVEFVNGKRIVQLSNFVLSFSRKMHGTWYDRGLLPNLIDSHKRAFKVFGGLTADFVYDNQKSVVAYRFKKEIILNGKFQKFAEYYGFKPVLCTPYRPNSKGKIERPFQYIEADFVRDRIFIDTADLNRQYEDWLEKTANQRVHGTTGKAPDALWEQERPALRSLPEKEYEYFELLSRKVATDCLISVEGNRYSLPWKYAGSTVSVKNYPDHFAAFSSTEKITEHKKTTEKNQMIIIREHYDGLRQRREPRQLSTMQARFKMLAEHQGEEYFLGLMRHHKACISMIGPRFLQLFENYPTDLLREIILACVKHEIYDFPQLREYLRKMPAVVTVAPLYRPYHSSVEPRDLRVYAEMGGTCHANR